MKTHCLLIISLLIFNFPGNSQEHLSVSTGLNLPVAGFNESFAKNGGAANTGYAFNIDFNSLVKPNAGIGLTVGHSINDVSFLKMEFDIERWTFDAQSGEKYQFYYAMPYFFYRIRKGKLFYDFKFKGGVINATFPKTKGLLYNGRWAIGDLNYDSDQRWTYTFIPSFTIGHESKKLVYTFDISYIDFSVAHSIKRPDVAIYTEDGVNVGSYSFPGDTRDIHYQNLTISFGAGFKF